MAESALSALLLTAQLTWVTPEMVTTPSPGCCEGVAKGMSYTIWFLLVLPEINTSASDVPCPTTILAVSSTGFCQEIFDEGDIGMGLSGGCGHTVMIPSL